MRFFHSLTRPGLPWLPVLVFAIAVTAQNALSQSKLQTIPDAEPAAQAGVEDHPEAEAPEGDLQNAPKVVELSPKASANLNSTGLLREEPEMLRVGAWIDTQTGAVPAIAANKAQKFLPGGGLWQSFLLFDLSEPLQKSDGAPGQVVLRLEVVRSGSAEADFEILPMMGEAVNTGSVLPDPSLLLNARGGFAPVTINDAAPERIIEVDLTRWIRQGLRHGQLSAQTPQLGFLIQAPQDASAAAQSPVALAWGRASTRLLWNANRMETPQNQEADQQDLDMLAFTVPDDPLRLREGETEVNLPPETRGWVDVTDTPFTVDPTGETDATESLQLALTHHAGFGTTLFLPNGTYLLNGGLVVPSWSGDAHHPRHTHIVGQSRDGVILKLAPNTPRFANARRPGVVLDSESSAPGVSPLMLTIENLTIQISAGNPGAVGLRLAGGSGSALRNIRVLDEAPETERAYIGVLLNSPPQANIYLEDVDIAGFQQGLVTGKSGGSVYAGDLTLREQARWGIWNRRVNLALRGVQANALPGFLRQSSGSSRVYGGEINLVEGAEGPVFARNDGRLLVFNLNVRGDPPPAAGLERRDQEFTTGTGEDAEVIGQAGDQNTVRYLVLQDAPMTDPLREFAATRSSGNLPTPDDAGVERLWEAQEWAIVNFEAARENAAQAIQQALDAGKPAVWLPFGDYQLNQTLVVPPTVREIAGGWSTVRLEPEFAAAAGTAWRFSSDSEAGETGAGPVLQIRELFLEAPWGARNFWFDNPARRNIDLRDVFLAGGRIYQSPADGTLEPGDSRPVLRLRNVHRTADGVETPGFSADWDLADHDILLFGSNPGNGEWLMPGSSLQPFASNALFQAPPAGESPEAGIVLEPLATFAPEGAETDMLKARLTGSEKEKAEAAGVEGESEAEDGSESTTEAEEINLPWVWAPVGGSSEMVGPYSSRLSPESPVNLLPFPNPDDLQFQPPRHYQLRPLQRERLDPASLRALQPIVVWDNDVALQEGLVRRFQFDQPTRPAADSSPRGIDGIAVNLQLEPPRQMGDNAQAALADDPKARAFHERPRVRLAQEGSQLVILPAQSQAEALTAPQDRSAELSLDPARAVALHVTPLPGGQEMRGLLYEEGNAQVGGFALWIAEGQLHAAAQFGVSSRVIVANLSELGNPPFHVVAQFHQGLLEIYVNGQRLTWQWADFRDLPSMQSAATGLPEGSAPSRVTRGGGEVRPFLGLIADLRVYNRALNPVEILHLAADYVEPREAESSK